jgi:hypothetical protein
MKKYLLIIVIAFSFNSCNKDKNADRYNISISSLNKSNVQCDSVYVYTCIGNNLFCDSLIIKKLPNNNDTVVVWDYFNFCNADGTFKFKVFLANKKELSRDCGYFSGSLMPYSKINLTIYSDSISLVSVLR